MSVPNSEWGGDPVWTQLLWGLYTHGEGERNLHRGLVSILPPEDHSHRPSVAPEPGGDWQRPGRHQGGSRRPRPEERVRPLSWFCAPVLFCPRRRDRRFINWKTESHDKTLIMSIYCIENTHVTTFSGNTILFYTRIDNFYKFFYSWWPWDRIWYGKTWLPLIDETMNTFGLGFRCLRLRFYNAWFYYLWKNNKKNGGTDRCFYKYRLILSQTWISSRQISFNLKKENNIRDWWLISRVWRAHWRPDVLVEEQHL